MQIGLSCFHGFKPQAVLETCEEKLMLEKLFGIPDTFCLHRPAGGGIIGSNVGSDVPEVRSLGLAHLREGLVYSQIIVVDGLAASLYQLLEVGASGFCRKFWLIGS